MPRNVALSFCLNPPGLNAADVFLVIPCYRESARLPRFLPALLGELEKSTASVLVQIVDDGSPPEEQTTLLSFVAPLREAHPILVEPLSYQQNRGKGHAIRTGWAQSGGYCGRSP